MPPTSKVIQVGLGGGGGGVPPTRKIDTGNGLVGGGDLSVDRTHVVVAGPDGSIVVGPAGVGVGVLATDAQHGTRGGGTQHALATPLLAGFMSPGDKSKLDGVSPGAGLLQDYQFGRNVQVPGSGTLVLYGPGDTTAPLRMNRNGTLTGASIQVNVVDGARAYDLVIYKNGAPVATVPLPIGSMGGNTNALAVPISVADLITAALVRATGVGASTFSQEHAMIEVKF